MIFMRDLENQLKLAKKLFYIILFFMVFLSSYAQVIFPINTQQMDSISQQIVGKVYPEFTLTNTNGDTITEQGLKGKITMINFWFESCAPCIFEMDALNQLISKFINNPDFQFLSFTVDSHEAVKQAVKKLGITYDVYPITPEESQRLFCTSYPTNLIIDQYGKVAYIKSGIYTNNIHIRQMELVTAFLLTEKNLKSPYSYSVSASIDSLNNPKIEDLVAELFKQMEEKRTVAIGSEYLDFNATTLQGKRITQDDLLGKITVIDFWEESCSPCVDLFDFFNNLCLYYKDNPAFQLFTFTRDKKEKAKKVVEKHNLLFDVASIENDEIYRLNYQTGFPTVLIINPHGIVSHFIISGFTEKEKNTIRSEIDNLLRELFSKD